MMVNFITRRIFMFIQFIVKLFKRALCCFKRRRRSSCEPEPLTNIGIVSDDGHIVDSQQNWESWDESQQKKTSPVDEHIRMYRQQRANLNQSKTEEDTPVDFFLDMTPSIVKPKKLLLQNEKTETSNDSSLFSMAPDPVFAVSADLGVWEENQSWEAEAIDDADVMNTLREQKRQERERRFLEQHKRKHERGRVGDTARLS